ncbi:MAG: DJ-1/PfpI family protein [Sulfurovum sp.]|nr:DJ-1/PfpI family protein [Sulfurovum sp.]
MASALVLLADGFEEIEAVSIIDILRRGGVETHSAYLDNEMVTGANGITIQANISLKVAFPDDYDIVVLPGGWDGTDRLAENPLAQSVIKRFERDGKWIAAMCAAPYALHVAGVLSKRYTCYPGAEEKIRPADRVADEKVVIDGKVITSQGPGTAICFGLEIVRQLVGEESYKAVREGTLSTFC